MVKANKNQRIIHPKYMDRDVLVEPFTCMERMRMTTMLTEGESDTLRRMLRSVQAPVTSKMDDADVRALVRNWLSPDEMEMATFSPMTRITMSVAYDKARYPKTKERIFKSLEEVGNANCNDVEDINKAVLELSGLLSSGAI